MAKRFDRWIANPQTFALPQAYDEFLSSEELPCLIDGCAWRGSWLTMHMNFTHGIRAEEFKRAAGFNASSGIIAAPLQKILSETRPPGNPHVFDEYRMAGSGPRNVSYFSNEAREHHQKGRALANLTFQAIGRTCLRCGKAFQQTSAMGLKKFCTITCRTQHYQEGDRQLLYPLVCATCGEEFLGNRLQRNNDVKGKPVCCTVTCKMRLNGSRPKPKHPKIESLNAS